MLIVDAGQHPHVAGSLWPRRGRPVGPSACQLGWSGGNSDGGSRAPRRCVVKSPRNGLQRWDCAPSIVTLLAATPVSRQAKYCGQREKVAGAGQRLGPRQLDPVELAAEMGGARQQRGCRASGKGRHAGRSPRAPRPAAPPRSRSRAPLGAVVVDQHAARPMAARDEAGTPMARRQRAQLCNSQASVASRSGCSQGGPGSGPVRPRRSRSGRPSTPPA